jgi:methylated-DNA-[protein]-cysteine S-methyltransferase
MSDLNDTIYYDELDSPVGTLRLIADEAGLRDILFERGRHPKALPAHAVRLSHLRQSPVLAAARSQLQEYFAGTRKSFDLPLHPIGTAFQRTVWRELGNIGYGITISYGELARRINHPSAVRAVGAANGRNPLPIVLPCHRVIGSDGSLTGFGGGLPTKEFLLRLEGWRAVSRGTICSRDAARGDHATQ